MIRILCCVFVTFLCVILQIDVRYFLPVESCFVGWRLVGCCSVYHTTCFVSHVVSLKSAVDLHFCCNLWNTFWLNVLLLFLPTGLVFLFLLLSWVLTLDLKRRYWLLSAFSLKAQYKVYYACHKNIEPDHRSELVSVD